jgi:hypothetical protein
LVACSVKQIGSRCGNGAQVEATGLSCLQGTGKERANQRVGGPD